MKRILLLLLAAVLAACLCACGSVSSPAETSPTVEPAPQPAPVTPAPPEPQPEPAPEPVPPDPDAIPWEVSTPMAEDSELTDPGSTIATWDPARAEEYPADVFCGEAALLEKWMAAEGITDEDLTGRECSQLILAVAQPYDPEDETHEAWHAVLVCYQRDAEGVWRTAAGGRQEGYVGRNGIHHDRVQGDRTSPAGLWQLGLAFGTEDKPEGLRLPWRDIGENSEWISDNDSLYYNTWQELDNPDLQDTWSDAEHLEDHKGYALACVIRFNMYPYTVRNKGNAIFLHCSEGATAGCVGTSRENMGAILDWLDPDAHPYILISGYEYVEQTEEN